MFSLLSYDRLPDFNRRVIVLSITINENHFLLKEN